MFVVVEDSYMTVKYQKSYSWLRDGDGKGGSGHGSHLDGGSEE
jgi:hypothetical protein